jgi:hypothetical protein
MSQKIVLNTLPNDGEIGVRGMKLTFCQRQDNNNYSEDKDDQTITFSTEDADWCDGDDGNYYYVLETERWAFDNIDEIIELFQEFKKKLKA